MITYLKGSFASITPSHVVIDVQGVGYEVNISLNTFSKIQDKKEGLLFTHLLIREDAHLLFGFADVKEREIFLMLLSVSGIGANTARLILSYLKPNEIAAAILNGDAKTLEQIKGIGKKTAERAVLELKDKVAKQTPDAEISAIAAPSTASTVKQDALEALIALGINRQQADLHISKSLKGNPALELEELIKTVLKSL
ncbi:Holliday junction branch migration protein RuvA [Niabella insulamsoli]|uniref:Holliday junction branch migration protein RuvA n=1 Tax=Niabella insulamsoli TaxID=3144874 RepID=UPI0031FBD115